MWSVAPSDTEGCRRLNAKFCTQKNNFFVVHCNFKCSSSVPPHHSRGWGKQKLFTLWIHPKPVTTCHSAHCKPKGKEPSGDGRLVRADQQKGEGNGDFCCHWWKNSKQTKPQQDKKKINHFPHRAGGSGGKLCLSEAFSYLELLWRAKISARRLILDQNIHLGRISSIKK